MSLPQFGTGNADLFATKRTGRTPTVLDPKVLAQITDLLEKHGIVQGQEFYTATKAETEAYNNKRVTAAKEAGNEPPAPITVAAMAERKARQAGNQIEPYMIKAVDTAFPDRSHSLRTVNQGTEDNPKVLWAFILVNKRAPRKGAK